MNIRLSPPVNLPLALILMMSLTACANKPVSETHQFPPPATSNHPKSVILDNDILEISYYLTNALQDSPYLLKVGDELRVELSGRPELTTDNVTVLPDGAITLNLIGSLYAASMTTETLTQNLYKQYRNKGIVKPEIAVILLKTDQRLNKFMESLINRDRGATLARRVYDSQLLELPFVDPIIAVNKDISFVRKAIRDSYAKLFGKQLNVTLNILDRSRQEIYVMGEVRNPGSIALRRGSNALMAIAAAGGLRTTADSEQAFVVRFKDDGSYYYWLVNHDAAFDEPDKTTVQHALLTSDIIYVPKSSITNIGNFVDQYIRKVLPLPASMSINRTRVYD